MHCFLLVFVLDVVYADWIAVEPPPRPTVVATIKTSQWRMITETTQRESNLSVVENSELTLLCTASFPVHWVSKDGQDLRQPSTGNPESTNRDEIVASKQYRSTMVFENFTVKNAGNYSCVGPIDYPIIIVRLNAHPVRKPAPFVQILQAGFTVIRPRPSNYYRYWDSRLEIPVVHTIPDGAVYSSTLDKPRTAELCFNKSSSLLLTGGMTVERKVLAKGVGQVSAVINHGSYICIGQYSFVFESQTKNGTRITKSEFDLFSDTIDNKIMDAEVITETESYVMLQRQLVYELRLYLPTSKALYDARLSMEKRDQTGPECTSVTVPADRMADDCGYYGFSIFDDGPTSKGVTVVMKALSHCTLTILFNTANSTSSNVTEKSILFTTVFDGTHFGNRFMGTKVFGDLVHSPLLLNDSLTINCLVPKCHFLWIIWWRVRGGFIWPPLGNNVLGVPKHAYVPFRATVNVSSYDDWTLNYGLHFDSLSLEDAGQYACLYVSSSSRKQDRLGPDSAYFSFSVQETKAEDVSITPNGTDNWMASIPPVFPILNDTNILLKNGRATVHCSTRGIPKPVGISWNWITNVPATDFVPPKVKLDSSNKTITAFSPGIYHCIENRGNNVIGIFNVHPEASTAAPAASTASFNTLPLAIAIPIVLVLLVLGVIALRCLKRKAINASFKRLSLTLKNTSWKRFPVDDSMPLNDQVQCIQYNRNLEVNRSLFTVSQRLLGTGEFGSIYKGELRFSDSDEVQQVAIKVPKDPSNLQAYQALTDELKIMSHIRPHVNVIRLIGACTQNVENRELYVLTELCDNGSLRDYLIRNTMKFEGFKVNSIGQFLGSPGAVEALLNYAYQAANGMTHLAAQKVIHRDLALRNLLLAVGHIVKIADFGMSRQHSSMYRKKLSPNVPVPVFWMALESLCNDQYTHKSDVWSFGVVLWEMFSCGKRPYPDQEQDISFRSWLKASENNRMGPPSIACEEIYRLMRDCWKENAEARPTFSECKRTISRILEQRSPDTYQLMTLSLSEAWLAIPHVEGRSSGRSSPTTPGISVVDERGQTSSPFRSVSEDLVKKEVVTALSASAEGPVERIELQDPPSPYAKAGVVRKEGYVPAMPKDEGGSVNADVPNIPYSSCMIEHAL